MSKHIYRDFKKVIERYSLVTEADSIAVELSGDRNNVVLLDCLLELKKDTKYSFQLQFFVVQTGNELKEETRKIIKTYNITDYTVISAEGTEEIYEIIGKKGCTKVALPHNYNDIINCTFMTLMQRKEVAQIQPKRESTEAQNLQFIRPLCTVDDRSIEKWMKKQEKDYVEEATLFSKLAFIEEKVVMPDRKVNTQFEFNIYESV